MKGSDCKRKKWVTKHTSFCCQSRRIFVTDSGKQEKRRSAIFERRWEKTLEKNKAAKPPQKAPKGADEKSERRYGTKKLRDMFPDTKMHLGQCQLCFVYYYKINKKKNGKVRYGIKGFFSVLKVFLSKRIYCCF